MFFFFSKVRTMSFWYFRIQTAFSSFPQRSFISLLYMDHHQHPAVRFWYLRIWTRIWQTAFSSFSAEELCLSLLSCVQCTYPLLYMDHQHPDIWESEAESARQLSRVFQRGAALSLNCRRLVRRCSVKWQSTDGANTLYQTYSVKTHSTVLEHTISYHYIPCHTILWNSQSEHRWGEHTLPNLRYQ